MRDEFSLSEDNGRAKALKVLNGFILDDKDDYTIYPTIGYCKWDFEVKDNKTHKLLCLIEAKDRQFPSTDPRVVKQGVQLESPKYDVLKRMGEKLHIPTYYLATFTDGVAYMWNIMTAETTEDERMANKTTAVDNGKVVKSFHYFMPKDTIFEETNEND